MLTAQNIALAQTGQAATPSLQVQVGEPTCTFTLMVTPSVASAPRMSTAPRTSIQIGPANLYNNHNLRHIMYVACTGDNCEQQRTESVITNLPVYWRWNHSDLKQTQMDLLIKHSHRVEISKHRKIFDYDTHFTRLPKLWSPETAVENWWFYLSAIFVSFFQ